MPDLDDWSQTELFTTADRVAAESLIVDVDGFEARSICC